MDKNQAFKDGMAANAALAAANEKLVRLVEQRRLLAAAFPAMKALGSNEAERKRVMTLELAKNQVVIASEERINEIGLQIDLQGVEVERLRRDVRLYTALAGGYSIQIAGSA
jgi:hypothetical protein